MCQTLRQRLLRIFDFPEKFQGDIPWIKDRFSPETIAKEYEKVMQDIVGIS